MDISITLALPQGQVCLHYPLQAGFLAPLGSLQAILDQLYVAKHIYQLLVVLKIINYVIDECFLGVSL